MARSGRSWKRGEGDDHYAVLKPFLLPIVDAAASIKQRDRTDCSPKSTVMLSSVIEGIDWEPADAIVRRAKGSDNWPMAWADDDALYTACGDGKGFEPFIEKKLSFGIAKVTGTPANFHGTNLASWMSGDGRTLYLVFSGDDCFSVRRGSLRLRKPK